MTPATLLIMTIGSALHIKEITAEHVSELSFVTGKF